MAFIPSAMFVFKLFRLIADKGLTKGFSCKSRAARAKFLCSPINRFYKVIIEGHLNGSHTVTL